jgi:multisubunit Na+/H+ antiporter MnhF subunit
MLQSKKKFWGKRPGLDSGDVIHVGVNILFALALFYMVRYLNLAALAGVLVILSKWRVLAVQPRFWLPNIKANLVDAIVGLSTVALLYQADTNRLALFWAGLFAVWLLFIKPKTSDRAVAFQALWAQFIGILTIFITTALLEVSFVGILLVWLVAWSASRHFLGNYEEPHYKTLSLVWALLVAQLAWVGFHWISYYQIFDVSISNIAMLVTVIAGVLGALYHSMRMDKLSRAVILEDILFGFALIAMILATSSWTVQL